MTRRSMVNPRTLGGMSRREFLKIGGAGLAGAALLGVAGCGGGSESAGGKVQLTLWHQEQPPNRVQQFQKVIDAFNKSQDQFVV
jgi:multiple sugar transport system substrate-binding protein